MKKALKLTLKIFAGLIGFLVLAAILIPIFFKDDIQKAIDGALDDSLNAKVFYDTDKFSVSLIRNFPNLSVRMSDFGIAGVGVFEKDTLVSVDNFNLVVDVMSLFGEITVNKIQLDQPKVLVLVMEDGAANYDIMKPSDETELIEEDDSEEAGSINISIKRWEISNAQVVYYDYSMPFYVSLNGVNHEGSGNFALDVFDMVTQTNVDALSLGYDGTEYMTNKTVKADVTMAMDLANMKFTFKENQVAVNDFAFQFDGYVGMPTDDIEMDINFKGSEINMKSVLSLIPGAYEEYLEGISATGEVAFDGFVKGIYNDSLMPAVKLGMQIRNGKVAMADIPQPLEKIAVDMTFDYPSADLTQTKMFLNFGAELAGQQTKLKLDFRNLDDYQWDVDLVANLDLEKAAKLLPMDSMTLKGEIAAQLKTSGRMSYVEAEQWEKLPTSGALKVDGLYFQSPDLPQGFGLSKMDAGFDPAKIELSSFVANAGRTDLNLSGKISNYLAFVLGKDEVLVGNLDFRSSNIDVNEWMTGDEVEVAEVPEDTFSLEIIRIPVNIDFNLATQIDQILYDNLTLTSFNGKVLVKDGSIILDRTGFNLLNGQFVMTGEYASVPEAPTFNFDFGITKLSIPASFKAFNTIQTLVPMADRMNGDFSTNFKARGTLGADMMPLMNTISGQGIIEIADAAIKDVKILDGIEKLASLKGGDKKEVSGQLKDVLLSAEIKDGRLYVKPFQLIIAGNEAVVSGSTGIDGSLDYVMAMKVPSGAAGQAVNQALSKFTGGASVVSEFVNLNMGITGSYSKPDVQLLGAKPSEGEKSLTASVKEQVQQKAEEKVAEVKQALKDTVNAKIDTMKASAAIAAKKAEAEAKKKADAAAKDAVKNLLKKKN